MRHAFVMVGLQISASQQEEGKGGEAVSATTKMNRVLGLLFCALAVSTGVSGASLGSPANVSASLRGAALSVAVEYYHPDFDHYFVTADPDEIEALASGRFNGWFRTGEKFAVLPSGSSVGGSTPVCRFFASRLTSHFYSGMPVECDEVGARFSDTWLLEADDVYRAFLPDVTGRCPSGTEAIYRVYNNRADANHRYTTNPAIAGSMISKGYIAEGLVSLCRFRSRCVLR